MNTIFAMILITIYCIILGYPIVSRLVATNKVEKFAYSLLLGLGLGTWLWYLGYLMGIDLTITSFVLISLIFRIMITVILRKILPNSSPKTDASMTKIDKFTLAIILTLGLAHLTITTYNPITAWDSLALYDFRGRTIAINHDLTDLTSSSYYLSYPLMVSLVHSLVYQIGAVNPQGFHTLLFIAMIIIIWARTKTMTNSLFASLAALLTLTNYDLFYHSSYAYTNIPYTVYLVTGVLLLLYPTKSNRNNVSAQLLIGGLLIGLSTWVRSSEPFWVLGIFLLLWTGIRSKSYRASILGIFFILTIRYSWLLYYTQALSQLPGVNRVETQLNLIAVLNRIITNYLEITWYIILNIIYPYLSGWIGAVFVLLATIRKRNTAQLQLTLLILILAGMVFAGIAVFSTYYATWTSIGDSARRMMLFLIPLIIISLSIVSYNTLYEKK
ncbi:MAG: hypothetical protein E6R05_00360 [Candidatus Moraniibacteriota bacterium]|nr:MAG: hypothetical protein E6R05_00360 [Candidatus Moranbacteria bacterium]